MDTLPREVLREEILGRIAQYAPALRAVCKSWRVLAAGKGEILVFLAKRGHVELLGWVRECRGLAAPFTQSQCDAMLAAAAENGHEELCRQVIIWAQGYYVDYNGMLLAAASGHIAICKMARDGATDSDAPLDFEGMLSNAARNGHIRVCVLAKEWGALDYDRMLEAAAEGGHRDMCVLAKEWGALAYIEMLEAAAEGGHLALCFLARIRVSRERPPVVS